MRRFINLILAAGCGVGTYLLLAPLAYAERGYQAYGGEVMAALAVAVIIALVGRWHRDRRSQQD